MKEWQKQNFDLLVECIKNEFNVLYKRLSKKGKTVYAVTIITDYDGLTAYFMPDLKSIDGFSDLLSLQQCYVMNVYKNDFPYFGFSFGCSWDQEHDLGFVTYKDRVVEIGGADLTFDTYTAEDDLENYDEEK